MCEHGRAILGRCNTRHGLMVHSDRREVGGEPESYTRAVDGAVLQASFECKGIPACVWDCPRYAKGMHSLVQPLRAHTRLGMAHFNAREVGHSNTSCARYERCHCEHHMTAKGSRHAFGMAKVCVRSVPTGVCMSTPALRTGAALDMMHFDGREVARSSKRCARSRRCRML